MAAINPDPNSVKVVVTGKRGLKGEPGEGVPAGGTTGQLLAKNSGDDHDTEWVDPTDISGKADLNSPTFTGTPAAPTAIAGTNTTQLATTAFVTNAMAQKVGSVTTGIAGAEAIGNLLAISQADYDALDPSIQNANSFLIIEA